MTFSILKALNVFFKFIFYIKKISFSGKNELSANSKQISVGTSLCKQIISVLIYQVKEVGHSVGIVGLASSLGLLVGDDLPDVLDDESPAVDVLQNFDAPTTAIRSSEIKPKIFNY